MNNQLDPRKILSLFILSILFVVFVGLKLTAQNIYPYGAQKIEQVCAEVNQWNNYQLQVPEDCIVTYGLVSTPTILDKYFIDESHIAARMFEELPQFEGVSFVYSEDDPFLKCYITDNEGIEAQQPISEHETELAHAFYATGFGRLNGISEYCYDRLSGLGFKLAAVIAHEWGHNFGMRHSESECCKTLNSIPVDCPRENKPVMCPSAGAPSEWHSTDLKAWSYYNGSDCEVEEEEKEVEEKKECWFSKLLRCLLKN